MHYEWWWIIIKEKCTKMKERNNQKCDLTSKLMRKKSRRITRKEINKEIKR